MKFILPKIHNFVDKSKNCENDSPKKHVHVVDGYAIVSNSIIVAVNLREYIKAECDIDSDEEFEELTELINWFNGKSFSYEFWNEFVKQSIVVLKTNDVLEVELNSYNKQMIWENPFVDEAKLKGTFNQIIQNICREAESNERIAANGAYYSVLASAFQKEIKSDSLIFQFATSGNAIKFTFSRRDYIFGIIPMDVSSTQSITAFANDSVFKELLENAYEQIKVQEVVPDFDSSPFTESEEDLPEMEDLFEEKIEEEKVEEEKPLEAEIPKPPKPPKPPKSVKKEETSSLISDDDEPELK